MEKKSHYPQFQMTSTGETTHYQKKHTPASTTIKQTTQTKRKKQLATNGKNKMTKLLEQIAEAIAEIQKWADILDEQEQLLLKAISQILSYNANAADNALYELENKEQKTSLFCPHCSKNQETQYSIMLNINKKTYHIQYSCPTCGKKYAVTGDITEDQIPF